MNLKKIVHTLQPLLEKLANIANENWKLQIAFHLLVRS